MEAELEDLQKQLEGEGLADIWKAIKGTFGDLFSGKIRQKAPPKVRGFLETYGDYPIELMKVGRAPILPMITKVINAISLGNVSKQQAALGYDTIFHLYLMVQIKTPEGSKVIRTEKDEVIKVREAIPSDTAAPGVEYREVPTPPPGLTLNHLFSETEKRVGSARFTAYDVRSTNCQEFVHSLLKTAGLLTREIHEFIIQDAGKILEKSPWVGNIAKKITDFAARVDLFIHGEGLPQLNYDV